MRLTPPQQTVEEEREAAWLRALAAGDTTIPDLMRVTGLGRSRIYERLKRARENRLDDIEEPESDATVVEHAASELPWVELVHHARPPTPHYDLATDRLEKPSGAFRIGDRHGRRLKVEHAGRGKPLDDKPKKKPPKFKPKSRKAKKRPVPAA